MRVSSMATIPARTVDTRTQGDTDHDGVVDKLLQCQQWWLAHLRLEDQRDHADDQADRKDAGRDG